MEFREYKKRLTRVAKEGRVALAIGRAQSSYRRNLQEAFRRFPHTLELAREVRRIKEESILRMEELVASAREAMESNSVKTFLARDAEEARRIIGEICGTGKTIVKGKSMTSEEIDLREFLEEEGNEVYETDLGEFLVQLLGIKPMHLLAPAVHLTREEVAELLSRHLGRKIPPRIEEEVEAVRGFLREKFISADVGITGTNVIAADTGAMVQIENEGNVRLASSLPPVHIVLVGIEKVVPTFQDAMKVAEVTWRYANYTVPAYVNVVSSPSKTGDIEKVTTYGAHGPRELYCIFLDGGRSRLARMPRFREALYCLRCGGCLYECPLFSLVAGNFGDRYLGGIGAIWTAFVTGGLKEAAPLIYSCLACGRCKLRCPMEIDTPGMCLELRRIIAEGEEE